MPITPSQLLAKSAGIVVILTIQNMATKTAIDISSATVKEFRIKPAHTKGVAKKINAAFVTNGTDGKLKFTTSATHFDVVGTWFVQAYLVMTGYSGYTTKVSIEVLDILEVA